jgi:hypothetical protein
LRGGKERRVWINTIGLRGVKDVERRIARKKRRVMIDSDRSRGVA